MYEMYTVKTLAILVRNPLLNSNSVKYEIMMLLLPVEYRKEEESRDECVRYPRQESDNQNQVILSNLIHRRPTVSAAQNINTQAVKSNI